MVAAGVAWARGLWPGVPSAWARETELQPAVFSVQPEEPCSVLEPCTDEECYDGAPKPTQAAYSEESRKFRRTVYSHDQLPRPASCRKN